MRLPLLSPWLLLASLLLPGCHVTDCMSAEKYLSLSPATEAKPWGILEQTVRDEWIVGFWSPEGKQRRRFKVRKSEVRAVREGGPTDED